MNDAGRPSIGEFLTHFKKQSTSVIAKAVLYYAGAYDGRPDLSVAELRTTLARGRSRVAKSNLASALSRGGSGVELATVDRPFRWRLTSTGRQEIRALLDPQNAAENADARRALTQMAADAGQDPGATFLAEAATCLEAGALRAAVVFAWVGSLYVLQAEMIGRGPALVDAAIRTHDPKARAIASVEDLAYVKEKFQLLAAEHLGLLDKGQRQMLEQALDLRNRCGHPGRYSPGPARVAATLEDLGRIVFRQT